MTALSLISTPTPASDLQSFLNALITSINTNLASSTSIAFAANGSVATAMSSVGPTGSHTTVQEWMTVSNASGVTRYVPCF